jgi:hypothetical protein
MTILSFKDFVSEALDTEDEVVAKLNSLGFSVEQNDSNYFILTVAKDAPAEVQKLYGSKKLNYPNLDQVKRFISALPRSVTHPKKANQ